MKWAIAANLIGPALALILIGLALKYTKYNAVGSTLAGLGCGTLAYAIIAPWIMD